MTDVFRAIFDSRDDRRNERSKYLSRLFGIFSERMVSVWANDPRAPFENLGRPTLGLPGEPRRHTLDFTFRDRTTGKVYVAEMKCEIEYQNFRYFVLNSSSQLDHHKKEAFKTFFGAARAPGQASVRVGGRETAIHGAILIWGAVDQDCKPMILAELGFHEILSIESIRSDLVRWKNAEYATMIETYRAWTSRLFDGLLSVDGLSQPDADSQPVN